MTHMFDYTGDMNAPDVFVSETYTDRWGTERAVLGGNTYDAKESIKFDWETTHHKPGENSKGEFAWIVDVDSLDALAEQLDEDGFTFGDPDDGPSPTAELCEAAEPGDRVAVSYAKKNGTGDAEKTGTVLGTVDDWLSFANDESGSTLRVKPDDSGQVGLFSSGYYPFMGAVNTVEITPADAPEASVECRCGTCGYDGWFADSELDADPCPECGEDTFIEAFPLLD